MVKSKLTAMVSIPVAEHLKMNSERYDLYQMLQTVLDTFGRTDGVCVTTQTKQHVLQNIRELLERVEHG